MEEIIDAEKTVIFAEQKLQTKYDALLDQYVKLSNDLDLVAQHRHQLKEKFDTSQRELRIIEAKCDDFQNQVDLYIRVIEFVLDRAE